MENRILGLHHITAIAGDAKRNYNFYTKVLGLRFVKRTVNFDDPYTYHFYFGDEHGSPGTILTFFPWGQATRQGRRGAGMTTEFSFAVPPGSFAFWLDRFEQFNVIYNNPAKRFGENYLTFLDPDGLKMELVIPSLADVREPFKVNDIGADVAIRGFHNATLTLNKVAPTASILTDIFGYTLVGQEVNRYRYKTNAIDSANVIDLVELPMEESGLGANGTVHHIAFRVKDNTTQMFYREKLVNAGLHITPQIDRNYFTSLYFREPGGVLFEIATDSPGFTVDETLDSLGSQLKLPGIYESQRKEIESHLVTLD